MIHVQTLDRKIWRRDKLLVYLHECNNKNINAVIDFSPEGSSAESLGLYRLLDEFCDETGFNKNMITIITGNMIEYHDEYNIFKEAGCWYEINAVQTWVRNKDLTINYNPSKHFANFVSRSNWFRLWTATILNKYHKDKTLQTYHYDRIRENYNANGYIGVDDLFRYECDLIPEAITFLQTCPKTIDLEFLKNFNNTTDSLFQHNSSYYPIQYPSNLNLLQYYNDIFVDIVVEPNISGDCFLVSEKLWRCIVARRPFIVVSNRNYLRNLRKLGFKTFSAWWSEEYDMYDNRDRIKKIENVLFEISLWSTQDLNLKLTEMSGILEYNYQTFTNLTNEFVAEVFYE